MMRPAVVGCGGTQRNNIRGLTVTIVVVLVVVVGRGGMLPRMPPKDGRKSHRLYTISVSSSSY